MSLLLCPDFIGHNVLKCSWSFFVFGTVSILLLIEIDYSNCFLSLSLWCGMEGGTSTLCLVKRSEGIRTTIEETVRGFMCCSLYGLLVTCSVL